jgi:hypothetical protein
MSNLWLFRAFLFLLSVLIWPLHLPRKPERGVAAFF